MFSSGFLEAFAAVLGAVITVAALYGSYRAARNTQSTSVMRQTAEAWEGKSKVQDVEISDLKEAGHRKDERIADLEARVSVLQDVVTGKTMLEQLEARTSDMVRIIGEVRSDLGVVKGEVRDMREILVTMNGQP